MGGQGCSLCRSQCLINCAHVDGVTQKWEATTAQRKLHNLIMGLSACLLLPAYFGMHRHACAVCRLHLPCL
jgi:hypothetical protein